MKTEAAGNASEPTSTGLRVTDASHTDPLSKCVRLALRAYLDNMGDHDVHDLYALVMEEVERPLFETVLQHTGGNLSQASRMLGMTRTTLRKRLNDYGVERER
ncbi:helix-turn-helix domain-containing protein [Marichromatium bheemlicum]|uniref:Putative Fis-like DNA-binding protein n=1 Tax=Marichromatium bheemlicum TaxID=365339 RepID=A0ABX1I5L5_9GAMM|nr:helix-turn-helix domain-containing protein [Marichromatium bheemlicum]NKN32874.1 Fis family transcriptional regulator [Marichromatium bheemlicum]